MKVPQRLLSFLQWNHQVDMERASRTKGGKIASEASGRIGRRSKVQLEGRSGRRGAGFGHRQRDSRKTKSPEREEPSSVFGEMRAWLAKGGKAQQIPINKAYLVSCTNTRASDIAAAARVFREAAKGGATPKIAPGINFNIAAASLPARKMLATGSLQALLNTSAEPLLDKLRPPASAYDRPRPVWHIAGPGWYQKPDGVEKVIIGEGSGDHEVDKAMSVEDVLDKIIAQAESMIVDAEKDMGGSTADSAGAATDDFEETLTDILPDGIYPDNLTIEKMAESGASTSDGSSRKQAATAILAKKIPLVIAGSFGNIFSRNSINNALMSVEVPRLVQRLRERFSKGSDGADAQLTRRTGWKLLWDVHRSKVVVTEDSGETWSQKVGELPPNVQEIIGVVWRSG
ncbi:hypothetical protein Egran_05562 [Elaphomyces granulatus]|uniref:Aconitase A/isopropylmalate dehydratase small subunit swivel domain-containing protein n=1 Tax=Elaphomyces granulatus TaxID=519963 RepID=A0A232LR80_9EURO|nr:hypothetical protein Egran_05562 [Elaphomyces granulatus]